ncbi:MAG: chemotaxis protein CheW [Gemmatimonadetes bacterium]|nr:chemotaxis protein CheW [Gemmatimonadota bacterium]
MCDGWHTLDFLDVRKRLTMPAKPLDQDEYLIVGRAGERTVAMRVDRVTGIEEIAPTDLVDPAGMAPGAQTVVGGVVKRHDGLMLIHDLQSFLSRAEAAALDEAVAATTGGGQAA